MNSYERLMARLKGEPVDRVPNLCILMGMAARHGGIPYRQFCLCPEKMVQANIQCHEDFDVDIVTVMSDPYSEAVDYGLKVEFPEDANPYVLENLWEDEPNLESLPVHHTVEDTVRMKARCRTISLYAEKLKGVCPIAGWVEGAVAEYCDLRNINEAMADFGMEEEFLDPILQRITDQALIYIEAQIKAGADIIGVGDAACSLMGPTLYDKYGFPYEKQMIDFIHEKGALAKLHICGNITLLLPRIAELKADIVDIDYPVDFAYAAKTLENSSAVGGNFDPVSVVSQGTPDRIRQAVHDCLAMGNNKTLVSAGCEIPPDTPPENLLAVAQALR